MAKNNYSDDDIRNNTIFSLMCYIPGFWIIPILFARGSKYCRFHINQGLILFVISIIFGLFSYCVNFIIGWLPFFGNLISVIANIPIGIVYPCLVIIGLYNVYKGEAKELPFVGWIRILKD